MKAFTYERARDIDAAVAAAQQPGARFIAGGTNLLDLMKVEVEKPTHLIDVSRLPLKDIADAGDGGLTIGAMVTNTDLAADKRVMERYPMLTRAIVNGASAQLRNQASTGGNLLQRTRCPYFYDVSKPCNKRMPGSGCSALQGINRMNAVLGGSDACIAVHPSDMAVAMMALDAKIETKGGSKGGRTIAIAELYRKPEGSPERDTNLEPGELITSVILPPAPPGRQTYRKVRDRASYAFALVSVAAILDIDDERKVRSARLALGGVGTLPWRAREAEQGMAGAVVGDKTFATAGALAVEGAQGHGGNDFKIPLAQRTIARAFTDLSAKA
jgi:xanthine dehydrogenase YagS FAD-binding subunit